MAQVKSLAAGVRVAAKEVVFTSEMLAGLTMTILMWVLTYVMFNMVTFTNVQEADVVFAMTWAFVAISSLALVKCNVSTYKDIKKRISEKKHKAMLEEEARKAMEERVSRIEKIEENIPAFLEDQLSRNIVELAGDALVDTIDWEYKKFVGIIFKTEEKGIYQLLEVKWDFFHKKLVFKRNGDIVKVVRY